MAANVAVTVVPADIGTVQLPVPEQPPPLQPANVEPAAGAAVSVAAVPAVRTSEQSVPQLMPGPVTVPVPVPALLTVSVTDEEVAAVPQASLLYPELPATLYA